MILRSYFPCLENTKSSLFKIYTSTLRATNGISWFYLVFSDISLGSAVAWISLGLLGFSQLLEHVGLCLSPNLGNFQSLSLQIVLCVTLSPLLQGLQPPLVIIMCVPQGFVGVFQSIFSPLFRLGKFCWSVWILQFLKRERCEKILLEIYVWGISLKIHNILFFQSSIYNCCCCCC